MASIKSTLAKAGINAFFFLLLLSILLAYLFPNSGSQGSVVPLDEITYYGVAAIFFFYGVKISPAALKAGLANWRLHLTVQSATFVVFPLVVLAVMGVWGNAASPLWLGTFYLAALPSTVSSSVVMVSIAKGNLPAAIFNASMSSLAGILLTPLWMGLYLSGGEGEYALGETIYKLVVQVLMPVIAGFALHRYLGFWVLRHQKWLKQFDQTIILLIVFSAFADSFAAKMFAGQSAAVLVSLFGGMLLLFLLIMGGMFVVGKLMRLEYEDLTTLLFCGSKKSLVQGAVMGKILFPDPVVFGILLLPLMIYHTLQLIVGSALAERLGNSRAAT
ncbi:Sodium/bile acid symporter family [Lunatimonas lonarensis]|uniref:Sodium/bile acid symporter family n=1 Tax=Lunatimonas lonarensis TaxID=1232681 RepID=R7ZPK2_9BACT|nr:bile acid:sodium symporter family protein [Lunatimonas lonarensis]EON75954.1 Sodium/bile acid symporter family [Lunatimonas lonarensis]